MSMGLVCIVAPSSRKERVPVPKNFRSMKKFWYHQNGKLFSQSWAGIQWSGSTLTALNEESGGLLYQINNCDEEMMTRLSAVRVQKLIRRIKLHIRDIPPDVDKIGTHSYITIHNLVFTFEKMVEQYGDRAWFWIG